MSIRFFAIASALFAAPLSAQSTSSDDESNVIVVTAKSLDDQIKALEDCLAAGCPPAEDMRLSLEVAETQFLEGSYRDGNQVLRGSIRRNRKHADELPIPVSGLYRASARFSEHLGEGKDYQLSTLDMRDILREGLGKEHWRTLEADIVVGDSRAKLGKPDDAQRIYERVENRAIELGINRIAMFARIRQAVLAEARFEATKRDYWRERSIERLQDIRDNPLKGGEEFSFLASVLLARLDRADGNASSTEELVHQFAERGGANRPILLYSDPLYSDEDRDRELQRAGSAAARLSTSARNKPTWIDVGFLIQDSGRVGEIEILRSEGDTAWTDQVIRHISSRVYAPLAKEDVGPGLYMIERYTVTSRFADQTTGTRMRTREPVQRIERLDITPENYNQDLGAAT